MFAFKNMAGNNTGNSVAEVEVAHDGLALAVHESFVEIEEVNGTLPVAMSNVYEMWAMDDTRSMDEKKAVMEGVIADAGKKIREFFKKLAAKIKGWWKSVVKYFETIFSSNEKFIEKYGDEIRDRDTADFSYEGHKWNYAAAKAKIDAACKAVDDYKVSNGDKLESKEELKKIDSAMGAKSPADYCTQVRKAAGADRTHTIKNMSGVPSAGEMINIVTNGKETIEGIEESASQLSSALDKIADDYGTAIDDAKGDADKVANLRVALKAIKYQYSYATQALSTGKELAGKMISEYSGVLRALARHTSKAEKEAKKRVNESAGLLSVWGGEF